MNLVIVESPAKAKTINKYLAKDYLVLASYGQKRDLTSKNASVYEREDDEYTNGIAPKRDITNQDEIVNKNACLIPSLIFFFLNEKYKIIPIKNVIMLE